MLEIWRAWIAAFDNTTVTGEWSKAGSFLTDDVTYIVAGVPFGCELRGRDNVLAGFAKSIENFDRKFDERRWAPVDLQIWSDQAVTCLAKGDYRLGETPPITFAAKGSWFFRGDRICLMTDIYDTSEVNAAETLQWLARYGEEMDPSYV